MEASASATDLIANQWHQLEDVMSELDSVKSKLAASLTQLRGTAPIHEQIRSRAEALSSELSARTGTVRAVVSGHVESLKALSDASTERAVTLKISVSSVCFILHHYFHF